MKHNKAKKPAIWITAEQVSRDKSDGSEQFVQLTVSDDGPGIRPEDRDVIFEKFATLSGENSKKGVGLGLPISARIIQLLGGTLTLEEADKGACFKITLPCEAPQSDDKTLNE